MPSGSLLGRPPVPSTTAVRTARPWINGTQCHLLSPSNETGRYTISEILGCAIVRFIEGGLRDVVLHGAKVRY